MVKHEDRNGVPKVGWVPRLLYLGLAVGMVLINIPLFAKVARGWSHKPFLSYQIAAAIYSLAVVVTLFLAGVFLYSAFVGFKTATDRIEEWASKVKLVRRLGYLLGSATCFWAVYGLYLALKWLNILQGAFGWSLRGFVFLIFLFTNVAGLAFLILAIAGRSLSKVVGKEQTK